MEEVLLVVAREVWIGSETSGEDYFKGLCSAQKKCLKVTALSIGKVFSIFYDEELEAQEGLSKLPR